MRKTEIRKPAYLLCERCGQSVFPLTGVCPICGYVNERLPKLDSSPSDDSKESSGDE